MAANGAGLTIARRRVQGEAGGPAEPGESV